MGGVVEGSGAVDGMVGEVVGIVVGSMVEQDDKKVLNFVPRLKCIHYLPLIVVLGMFDNDTLAQGKMEIKQLSCYFNKK